MHQTAFSVVLERMTRIKQPLTYYGGKQRMVARLLPLVPSHTLYCEPFAGGASLFWAKVPAPLEVLNDRNGEIVNFYRVLSTRTEELALRIRTTLHSRREHDFADLVYRYPEFFDPVTRAWAVWVQCTMSFASAIGNHFGYSKRPGSSGVDGTLLRVANRRARFTDEGYLNALAERLEMTQLECRDALEVIRTRDTAEAFFYLDPPYPGSQQGHYSGYRQEDFERLLSALRQLKGRFLLSCYPNPALSAAVEACGWHYQTHEVKVSAGLAVKELGGSRRTKVETLTANYPLPETSRRLNLANEEDLVAA